MRRRYFAVLLLSLSASACKQPERHDPLAVDPAAAPAPSKPKKPLAELFSAKAPTFPAFFNGVTPGMTVEEAQKKIPGLDKDLRLELPDYDTRASLFANDDKRILTMSFSAGKDALALATTAWGKPTVIKETGRDVNVWFNPEAKVRAKKEATEYSGVTLQSYIPATELLGSDKAGPAFQKAHPLIGMTADDVRKHYAANVLETSAEKNAATLAAAQKFAGTHANLGASQASIDLVYPPTEYGAYDTKVHLYFDKGKVNRYTFGVEFEPSPQQKEDVLALLKKTYGEPKKVKDFSHTLLAFRKAPTIKVEDDSIMKRWSFTVEK
ncbi:MAG TPA: hypothetical protein VIF57_31390 [Polyangia bacterium]|jgi:hypothetical protein